MSRGIKKILNDLRGNAGRTALVVLALSLGLWGLGFNVVSFTIMQNDLNENFLRSKPYHVAIGADDFPPDVLRQLAERPEIEAAEFRDLSFLRIEAKPGYWLPLWLFAVDDFSHTRLAHLYPQVGSSRPSPGSVLIERNGKLVSNLVVGTLARVRVGGKTLSVPVSGITFDPAQAPATQDAFIYAYTDPATYTAISGQAAHRRLLLRFRQAWDKEQVQVQGERVADALRAMGVHINGFKSLTPNKHPHQFQLNTLLGFQACIGLLALIMSAVLVAQLMESILARQIRQIGIMKAIGASRGQVLRLYLLMVMLLGVFATVLALPAVVASGYGFAGFVAMTLNFDILTKTLPVSIYTALVAAGLLLPVAVSLPALLRGTRVAVKDTFADYGLAANAVAGGGVPGLLSHLTPRLQLAARNILRRRRRLWISVSMIALGVALFSAGFNVRQSLLDFLQSSKTAMRYDVQVSLRERMPAAEALQPFQAIANVAAVETWSGGQGRMQSDAVATSNGVGIVALPYDTRLMRWELIAGRWLRPGEVTEVVFNQLAAEEFAQVRVGDTFSLLIEGRPTRVTLAGIVKEFNPPKVYIDKTRFDALAQDGQRINSLLFTAVDRDQQAVVELKRAIEAAIDGSDLNVLAVTSQTERAQIIYNHLAIIISLFTLLSLLVLVVSALGMASATGITIIERTREIGVMRAIGATPKMIYGLFVTEGLLVSAIGMAVALLLSLPLSFGAAKLFGKMILGHNTSLNFAFSATGLLVTLVLTLFFAWLASRLSAAQAVKVSTREALTYE